MDKAMLNFVFWAAIAIAATAALYALGDEPEITAADYRQWLCQDSPGLPECRTEALRVAGE